MNSERAELLRPYRSDCVQPHWDLMIRMKRWAAIGWPRFWDVFSFGYFDVNTTPSRRSMNLLRRLVVKKQSVLSRYAQVAKYQGVQIVWPCNVAPSDASSGEWSSSPTPSSSSLNLFHAMAEHLTGIILLFNTPLDRDNTTLQSSDTNSEFKHKILQFLA